MKSLYVISLTGGSRPNPVVHNFTCVGLGRTERGVQIKKLSSIISDLIELTSVYLARHLT